MAEQESSSKLAILAGSLLTSSLDLYWFQKNTTNKKNIKKLYCASLLRQKSRSISKHEH